MSAKWKAAVRTAGVGEVIWVHANGAPDAAVATPLLYDDKPAVAFTYAHVATADAFASAATVALVLSDRRLSGRSWQPLVVLGTPRVIDDPEGDLYAEHLMVQELRKFPPSRALADSIMLRREHWWYLPRRIAVIEPAAVIDVAEREPGHGVLAVRDHQDRLRFASVETGPGGRLRPVGADRLSPHTGCRQPAVLVHHDFSVPDLERWPVSVARGALDGDTFVSDSEPAGPVALPRPLGLLTRLRRHRKLERACRRALAH